MSQSRIARLRQVMDSDTPFLVSNLVNIRYLSGFTGSNALLLISMESAFLLTDSRYEIQSRRECPEIDVVISRDLFGSAIELLQTPALAIEGSALSVTHWQRIAKQVPDLQVAEPLIEGLRIVKDSTEIAVVSKACDISTASLEILKTEIHFGMTERQIARRLESLMLDMGADSIAFQTIVASGPNSAIPHHKPTDRPLQKGDLLKIDFGALVDGYHADCTRTFTAGKAADWQKELHECVLASQHNGIKALAPDVDFGVVVRAANAPLQEAGFMDKFTHGLGHGVGLEIHEQPFLSSPIGGKIVQNMVVTIEPGVYLPDLGGIRIEDTIVITSFASEVLTKFTYELTSVG